MIRTDGISICVLFVSLENGKKLKGLLASNYIENVKNISEINKKFVVADPGKSYIFYCGYKNEDDELETFRYINIIHKVHLTVKQLIMINFRNM
jgi:hypothetical protein